MEKKCCVCGKEFIGYGNNASPVKKGVCCDYCNTNFVVPARIFQCKTKEPVSFEILNTFSSGVNLKNNLKNRNFEKIEKVGYMDVYSNMETGEKVVICLV